MCVSKVVHTLVLGVYFLGDVFVFGKEDLDEGLCSPRCECVLQGSTLRCSTPNTLTKIPQLANKELMANVTQIHIQNQKYLTNITSRDLGHYTNVHTLTVVNCSVNHVCDDAFRHNPGLQSLNLRNNKLETISWKIRAGTSLSQLDLSANPLVCNCSLLWLQRALQNRNIRPPDGAPPYPQCRDGGSLKNRPLGMCDPPTVSTEPEGVIVNSTGSATITCSGAGFPPPRVYWNTTGLWSDIWLNDSNDGLTRQLHITRASTLDNGWISCTAANLVNQSTVTIRLEVRGVPVILDLRIIRDVRFFDCIEYSVISDPEPILVWYHNGDLMNGTGTQASANHYPRVQKFDDVSGNQRKIIKGCLSFRMFSYHDNGQYTLVATNSYGSTNKSLAYTVGAPNVHDGRKSAVPFGFGLSDVDYTSWDDQVPKHEVPQPKSGDELTQIYVTIGGACLFVFIALLIAGLLYRRHHRKARQAACQHGRTDRAGLAAHETMPLTSGHVVDNPNYNRPDPEITLADTSIRQIPAESISYTDLLGEGAFGRVYLGSCRNIPNEGDSVHVAIKVLKNTTESSQKDTQREAELLTDIVHNNVVTFYGISWEHDNFLMVFEYMENGDLNGYLWSHGPDAALLCKRETIGPLLTEIQLLHIANQIAQGMAYLATRHFVHRDLATRNCLVGLALVVKIGDFGMSRNVYSTDYYRVGGSAMLPVRWMPPESLLYRTFSVESDVWSFGVLLWEIFTYGRQPWYQLLNHEVIQYITNGHLLEMPDNCPDEVARIMAACWKRQPQDRSTMKSIHHCLEHLCLAHEGYLDLLT